MFKKVLLGLILCSTMSFSAIYLAVQIRCYDNGENKEVMKYLKAGWRIEQMCPIGDSSDILFIFYKN